MPMRPEDFAIFDAHLRRCGNNRQACSECGTNEWLADGPIAAPIVQNVPAGELLDLRMSMPVVFLVCRRCAHMRFFAWIPIRNAMVPNG